MPEAPFNDIEHRTADALATFDLDAQRAEHPGIGSASLWVALDDGGELYVSAILSGTNNGNPTVIGEDAVDGVVIRTVEYETGLTRLGFDCGSHEYEVSGDAPAGHDGLPPFAAALARSLGCA